ncbi:MAG: hypothetical protein IPN33_22435, partial [Saprospiraceae bacterium]|nr:hypothetical protein [Saprospiraceae bacterium]
MNYNYYKGKYPYDILVYIEEYNIEDKSVLFDFLDFGEYTSFIEVSGSLFEDNQASMVLLKNYSQKRVQENTIYAIKPPIIQSWVSQEIIENETENSFLIGYSIDLEKYSNEENIFGASVSIGKQFDGLSGSSIS